MAGHFDALDPGNQRRYEILAEQGGNYFIADYRYDVFVPESSVGGVIGVEQSNPYATSEDVIAKTAKLRDRQERLNKRRAGGSRGFRPREVQLGDREFTFDEDGTEVTGARSGTDFAPGQHERDLAAVTEVSRLIRPTKLILTPVDTEPLHSREKMIADATASWADIDGPASM